MKHEKSHEPGHAGHEHTEVAGIRFEETDINYRPITLLAIYGVAVFTCFFAVAWGTFKYLEHREATTTTPANPLAERYARKEPPEPRLQADPRADLLALRASEDAALGKLSWVNRRNGVVQVPIERAMEIIVKKGLPARSSAAAGARPALPSPMPATPAAPTPSLQPSTHAPGQAAHPAQAPGIGGDSGTSSPRPADAHQAVSPSGH